MPIKVSIIIPVHKVEKYLEKCLHSLVNQTLRSIEVLVVVDASPDNSSAIARKFEKSHPDVVKVFYSEENKKAGGARNIGLEKAKGEFIGFVDGDHWVDLKMYEKLYEKALATGSDIVGCDYFRFYEHENRKEARISNTHDQLGVLDIPKKKKLLLRVGRLWTKIYKRRIFKDNEVSFPELIFYEDIEITPLLMVLAHKLTKVKDELYYYRIRPNSISKKPNSYQHFDRLKTTLNMVGHFRRKNFYATYRHEVDYRVIRDYYLKTIALCLNEFEETEMAYLKKVRRYMKMNFPNYRANPYFKTEFDFWQKLISYATDLHPRLAESLNNLRKTVKQVREKTILKLV